MRVCVPDRERDRERERKREREREREGGRERARERVSASVSRLERERERERECTRERERESESDIPCCTPIAVTPDLMSDPKAERADTSLPLHRGTGQLGERKENGVFAEVAEVAVPT